MMTPPVTGVASGEVLTPAVVTAVMPPAVGIPYSTPATSTPIATASASTAPTVPSLSHNPTIGIEAAWTILMADDSWKAPTEKNDWQVRLGAHKPDALEYIIDSEIDELETLLAPIAFRRFKKLMNK